MDSPRSPAGAPPTPVPGQVVLAAMVLAAGVLPTLFALPHDRVAVDATLPVLGWLPVGVAGVLVLDRRPDDAVGRAAVLASTTPTLVLGWTVFGNDVDLPRSVDGLGEDLAAGPWWLLPALLVAVAAGRAARGAGRTHRRWGVWLAATPVLVAASGAVTWLAGSREVYGATATAGLLVLACVVACSAYLEQPRPVDEPLLDLLLTAGVLGVGLLVWVGVRWFAAREQVFAAEVVAAFAGATSLVLATPGAVWLRRELLTRRYGRGVLDPADVAAITAGLRPDGDPRSLLATAEELVSATSGTAAARITLSDPGVLGGGPDELADRVGARVTAPWCQVPLVVGDDVVGVLAVRATDPDGLEARQDRVVSQLAPTIALVARAVSLAVEAQHARSDLALEREAERRRILADLHDDLGPVLAGMSMRVGAAHRLAPTPELAGLSRDLATARADLRRIVAGLTPSALTGQEAGRAIRHLVESFRVDGGPEISLEGEVPPDLGAETAVAVYRTVAEAVTNTLRHAGASRIDIRLDPHPVDREPGLVLTVRDDGHGGVVVPGVGLTSLQTRARAMGGTLEVTAPASGGTTLTLALPVVRR